MTRQRPTSEIGDAGAAAGATFRTVGVGVLHATTAIQIRRTEIEPAGASRSHEIAPWVRRIAQSAKRERHAQVVDARMRPSDSS